MIKQEMHDFQSSFLDSCECKSTETLWTELKAKVDFLIDKYVPVKVLRGRKNLPWVTSEIKRMMNKRDLLYQVQKSGNEHDRALFQKADYEVDCKLKTAYNNYLNSLVGHDDIYDSDTVPRSDTKKLFSYLKNCRQDCQGTAPLRQNGQLHTDNVKKANILNEQFQSVFQSHL